VLNPDLSFKANPEVFVAGQLSGVEGYTESIGFGLLAALQIAEQIGTLPVETILGQLQRRLQNTEEKRFQPCNANFGLLPDLEDRIRDKKLKRELLSKRSLTALAAFLR
jgi:methylenetetrahydrofolate--tRNA-(uracil-5-)-methyltransferase